MERYIWDGDGDRPTVSAQFKKPQVVLRSSPPQRRVWHYLFRIQNLGFLKFLIHSCEVPMEEKVCWEQFKHRYGPDGELRAWADYQRAYQQWRRSCRAKGAIGERGDR